MLLVPKKRALRQLYLDECNIAESLIESRLATENHLWHGGPIAEISSSFAFMISLCTF